MAVLHALIAAIASSLFLLASPVVFPSLALAQVERTHQEEIAAFASKLEDARNAKADLDPLVVCLDRRDAHLVQQRGVFEGRLGLLRTEEAELVERVRTQEAAYQQFKTNFEAEQVKVLEIRKTIETMPGRSFYQQHKRDCASSHAADRMACGRRMGRDLFGHFDRMEAQLNDAGRREQIALGSMNAEKRNLDESQSGLATTRGQLDSLGVEIGRTERGIVLVKATLADVRELLQAFRIVIDDFAGALHEAEEVDLADERPRTLRKLGDIAVAVDATMARGRAAVSNADETLGASWKQACGTS